MPRHADPDPPLPALFTAAQAIAAGLSAGQIQHRVRSGRWVKVARGHYRHADGVVPLDVDAFARARIEHVHRAIAAQRRNPSSVIAFHSAALVHGLPLFDPLPPEPCLIVPPGRWAGQRSGVIFRRMMCAASDVDARNTPVTTPTRTWLDLARSHSLADALAAGDGGLRAGLLAVGLMRRSLDEIGDARGSVRAATALAHLDARRESPLESGSWAYFIEHCLPLPQLQVSLHDDQGGLLARVDFLWEEACLVGECDGRLKYTSMDVLYAEKRREDELRSLGLGVVRWGWRDLTNARLAMRLRRSLDIYR
jgi:hypothetical protein